MKTLSRLLTIFSLATAILLPTATLADQSHYPYTVSDDNATITGYTGPGGDITIPETLGGYAVTSIGNSAFRDCTSLTSVTIPDSVTSIGYTAFSGCTALTSVTIPDSVTSIGGFAFSHCSSLTSLTIPGGVTSIGNSAFQNCTSLTSITVVPGNPSYSSLDGVLFNKNQTDLVQYPIGRSGAYVIPDSVTSIGDSAFRNCTSLTSVTIPDGVTSISHSAFSECTALTSIYFCGTPPVVKRSTFSNVPATLYFLPQHADQWPATLNSNPTALWMPSVTESGISASGAFMLSTSWAPGEIVTIEAATCLGASDWTPLITTNIPSSGSLEFTDPNVTDHATRFYRVVVP